LIQWLIASKPCQVGPSSDVTHRDPRRAGNPRRGSCLVRSSRRPPACWAGGLRQVDERRLKGCSWSVSHAPRRRCPPGPVQLWPRRSCLHRGRPCGIGRFDHRSQSSVRTIRASVACGRMNVEAGWCRDVSDVMADKVCEVAQREDMELTDGSVPCGSRARGEAGDAAVVVRVLQNRPSPDRAHTAVGGHL